MDWNDFYALGEDTERWWREHVRHTMPHLRHAKAKGYDFKGHHEEVTTLIDVKFCRTQYRCPGWIEVKSRGKLTGIVNSAKESYNDMNTLVGLVVMECGKWYLHDVKGMLLAWRNSELPIINTPVWDEAEGKSNRGWNWQMKGWNDPRFLICEGPLRKELWKPRSTLGKRLDIDAWFEGEFIL
jgi:hypothetical protein